MGRLACPYLGGNVLIDGKITWLKETSVLSAHPIGSSDQDLKDKKGVLKVNAARNAPKQSPCFIS